MTIARSECALCGRTEKLCRSHIIPEFLCAPIYDGEKHRYEQFSTDPEKKMRYRQTGIFESLLCRHCEGRFQKWESYAAQVLNGGTLELEYQNVPGGVLVRPIEYKAFKLFGLSMLWRAGVSRRPEFAGVRLGPYELKLRQMLLREDPGPYWDHGAHMSFISNEAAIMGFGKSIVMPETIKLQAHHGHRFIIGVMAWIFVSSNHMHSIGREFFALSENGDLRLRSGGQHMHAFLGRLAETYAAAHSKRIVTRPSLD